MPKASPKSQERAEIILSLRQMIWVAVCRDREPEGQLVGFSVTNHPCWQEHISQLSALAGESEDDCISVQGVMPWEKFRKIFRDVPDLIESIAQSLAEASPRLTVCTIFIDGNVYEITYLKPLAPPTLN